MCRDEVERDVQGGDMVKWSGGDVETEEREE